MHEVIGITFQFVRVKVADFGERVCGLHSMESKMARRKDCKGESWMTLGEFAAWHLKDGVAHILFCNQIVRMILMVFLPVWLEHSEFTFEWAHYDLVFLEGLVVIYVAEADWIMIKLLIFSHSGAPPLFCLKNRHLILNIFI